MNHMKRSGFLKTLTALVAIPFAAVENILPERKRTALIEVPVRGFQYYDGPGLLGEMGALDRLLLVREPENRYDHNAIAFYYRDHKIGFVPREKNEVLARLMDAEVVRLFGEIEEVDITGTGWVNVRVKVFISNDPVYSTAN
jgi:hypothetical protein